MCVCVCVGGVTKLHPLGRQCVTGMYTQATGKLQNCCMKTFKMGDRLEGAKGVGEYHCLLAKKPPKQSLPPPRIRTSTHPKSKAHIYTHAILRDKF